MIKNIIFDMDGVVLTADAGPVFDYYSKKLDLSQDIIEKAFDKWDPAYNRGELSDEKFLEGFFKELGRQVDKNFFKVKLGFKNTWPEMMEFLDKLKEDYKLFYITNEGEGFWTSVLEKTNIQKMFDGNIASYEIGIRKPDERIFQTLLERNGMDASECVFVDDSARNLEGAKKLGMMALHFTGLDRLQKDLGELGV